jgi:F1F0 ATPase subunit 2
MRGVGSPRKTRRCEKNRKTTMREALELVLASIAGAALGAIFFGGLWWTVRRVVSSKQPALWFLGSLLLRTSIALAGFYFVSGGRWDRLLVCLLGFVIARVLVTWLSPPPTDNRSLPAQGAIHAP